MVTNEEILILITYVALVPSPRSRVTLSIIQFWKRYIYIKIEIKCLWDDNTKSGQSLKRLSINTYNKCDQYYLLQLT